MTVIAGKLSINERAFEDFETNKGVLNALCRGIVCSQDFDKHEKQNILCSVMMVYLNY